MMQKMRAADYLLHICLYTTFDSCGKNGVLQISKRIAFQKSTVGDVHQPGIEPGSVPWQGTILPLDHWCFVATLNNSFYLYYK